MARPPQAVAVRPTVAALATVGIRGVAEHFTGATTDRSVDPILDTLAKLRLGPAETDQPAA